MVIVGLLCTLGMVCSRGDQSFWVMINEQMILSIRWLRYPKIEYIILSFFQSLAF